MLILVLLEKKTKKTLASSSLPGLLTPFDQTTPSRKGAKSKGPKRERGELPTCASKWTSKPLRGSREDHQRRLLVNIEFVTKQSRIDAEIKRCPNCQKINCGSFPETLPAPLQNGSGIVAFAADLLISRMVPLRRTAQMLKLISRRQIFEATLLK